MKQDIKTNTVTSADVIPTGVLPPQTPATTQSTDVIPATAEQVIPQTASVQPEQVVPQTAPVQPEQAVPQAASVQSEQVVPQTAPAQPEQVVPQTAPVQPEQAVPQAAPVQVAPQSTQSQQEQKDSQPTYERQPIVNTPEESKILKSSIKRKKWPIVLFIFISMGIIAFGVYFFLQSKDKYDNYVVIGADLLYSNKDYQAGRPYYTGVYQYYVDGKQYKYNNPTKYESDPDKVIQIKYNPKDPSKLYDKRETIFFGLVTIVGGILFIVSFGILISITSKKDEKIVVVEVYDIFTCVGGRKIYMKTINPDGTPLKPEETEYFVYFTNQLDKFPFGKRIKFNAFKRSRSIVTERYKDIMAMTVNELHVDDFIFLN